MSSFTIHKTDSSNGTSITQYVVSPTPSPDKSIKARRFRVDVVQSKTARETPSVSQPLIETLWTRLLLPFLPTGYPASVTSDYTPYQLYDTLQAFASTIAGLLASRAVLLSLNLGGDSESTSKNAAATGATLLSIAQESIGRGSTIFFAHLFARQIESEVKFYRFFADIVNDIAFILDCLSPSLPFNVRVPALCIASACRAICGVAGGSSKAILSAHFAKYGNIGELNAKDGSQETVVSLVGMWIGGLVVSRVHGTAETWLWLLSLLALHLWANWQAVKSVRLRVLNGGRASIVLHSMLEHDRVLTPDQVGEREGIFRTSTIPSDRNSPLRACHIGVDLKTLISSIGGRINKASGSLADLPFEPNQLFEIFTQEQYILWLDSRNWKASVVLKDGATSETQLKSCYHAQLLAKLLRASSIDSNQPQQFLKLTRETLDTNNAAWPQTSAKLNEAGWNVSSTNLDVGNGTRIQIQPTK